MRVTGQIAAALAVALLALMVPSSGLCAQRSARSSSVSPRDAARVRADFQHAWNGYKKYAWGHDALKPLSKTPRDWYGPSLLMTPVDAYDTMVLMGLKTEAAEAKQLIFDKLSFDQDVSVQVFEVNIRLLGGLLSAYQMDGDTRFLELAKDLGNRLLPAFESPTGMPYTHVNLRTGKTRGEVNNPAEIGTLMLEFGTLSKLTGNPAYYEKAKHGITEVYKRRSPIGLVGSTLDVRTGEWKNTESHISGYIDSYYEYLLKSWLLFGDEDFRTMWRTSIAAVNKYLADEQPSGLWYRHVDMNTGRTTATHFGALDAFMPAVLVLGADTTRAAKLMKSVYKMWTTFDVEPEEFDYVTMKITDPQYVLRPESIESAFYMYRFTGNPHYQAMGRDMFDRIVKYCRTDDAYAALTDVRTKARRDGMESFFFAETLKYSYLLFAPQGTIDLKKIVFNTEAHPLRRTW
jgi:mannosidase alpha-like ER degradation enhancer 2